MQQSLQKATRALDCLSILTELIYKKKRNLKLDLYFPIVHSWEEEEADRAKAFSFFPSALPEVRELHVKIRKGL